MTLNCNAGLTVGKYLVSPLVRHVDGGGFSASVSIRSGRGSHTHDRVLRLLGWFASPELARSHALTEGLDFLRERFGRAGLPPTIPQGVQ